MTKASLVLIAGNVVMKSASLDTSETKKKMKHRLICKYGHNYISPLHWVVATRLWTFTSTSKIDGQVFLMETVTRSDFHGFNFPHSIFDPLSYTGTQWIVDKVMVEHSLHFVLICDVHTARFPLDCSQAAVCPCTLFRLRCRPHLEGCAPPSYLGLKITLWLIITAFKVFQSNIAMVGGLPRYSVYLTATIL